MKRTGSYCAMARTISRIRRFVNACRIPAAFLATATMLLAVGCAGGAARRNAAVGALGGGVDLHVNNRASGDMRLFLVRNGVSIRIGDVPGFSARTFGVSAAQLGSGREVHLMARVRSNAHERRSRVFTAAAGQRIVWMINMHPSSDMVQIR